MSVENLIGLRPMDAGQGEVDRPTKAHVESPEAASDQTAKRPDRVTAEEKAIVANDRTISVAHARLEALFDEGSFDEIGAGVLHRCDAFGLESERLRAMG